MPKLHLKPLREQVVVVMGASSGIGRATAAGFAAQGAKVVVAARGEAGLRSLVEEIRAGGGEACAEVADVTDPAQVRRVAQRAVTEYGRLDTWVHAAAVLLVAPFEQTTPEEFQRVIDVNLMGQVHGAMAALPHLREQGGALIHISSMGAKRGVPLQTAYCAAKHGIDGFVETCGWRSDARSSRSASPTSCRRRSTRRCSTRPAPRSASSPSRRRRSTSRTSWWTPSCTPRRTPCGTWSSADRRRRSSWGRTSPPP